jgi:hypothetical protein
MDLLYGGLSLGTQHSSQAVKQLRPILTDDNIRVLSSFDLNSIASLTFNDKTCDDMFEYIQSICSQPMNYSPLTIQKSLVVTKHILIYGSEKTVNYVYGMQAHVMSLLEFNTVLMQQQNGGGWWIAIQGGGVDKGAPVREAATEVMKLLGNINELRRIRNAKASQESLVPVGSNEEIAFVSDDVRHQVLMRRMEKERQVQIKSNLAKAEGGWGAGYTAKDGRSVVGAAHGIDEMIKMAKIEKKRFSDEKDDATPGYKTEEERILEELKAEADAAKAEALAAQQAKSGTSDLTQQVDLLDFGSTSNTVVDGSGSAGGTSDLLGGFTTLAPTPLNTMQTVDPFNSMPSTTYAGYGFSSQVQMPGTSFQSAPVGVVDPFAPQTAIQPQSSNGNGLTATMNNMSVVSVPAPFQLPTAGSNDDRFAALDALASTSTTVHAPTTTSMDSHAAAENRTLGGFSQLSAVSMEANSMGFCAAAMTPTSISLMNMVSPGSGQVAKSYGDTGNDKAGEDNPWVMGGATGTGLQPLAPAPGTPPPPPPSDFY